MKGADRNVCSTLIARLAKPVLGTSAKTHVRVHVELMPIVKSLLICPAVFADQDTQEIHLRIVRLYHHKVRIYINRNR